MTLVDTSIWIDHLRKGDNRLRSMLNSRRVLFHPVVIGEVAMGRFRQRDVIFSEIEVLPRAIVAHDDEVLQFVSGRRLFGLEIGYIDVRLLAAVKLSPGALLWTRDKRLLEVARSLHLAVADS